MAKFLIFIISIFFVQNSFAQVNLLFAKLPGNTETIIEFPEEIDESSGLAVSRKNPGIFWTHNDSGGKPILYGIHPEKGIVAKLILTGIDAIDWEDLELARCSTNTETDCLYVADIGDNMRVRDNLQIYVVYEPEISISEDSVQEYFLEPRIINFFYEDRVSHNSEGLAITPDLDLLVVTKGTDEKDIYVYRLAYEEWYDEYPIVRLLSMKRYGELDIMVSDKFYYLVTGATYFHGLLAIRTYMDIRFYLNLKGDTDSSFEWTEVITPPCAVVHLGQFGEGIAMDNDTGRIYLSNEYVGENPGKIVGLDCF